MGRASSTSSATRPAGTIGARSVSTVSRTVTTLRSRVRLIQRFRRGARTAHAPRERRSNPNDVLQTDGSGALSWVAQSGGGGTSYTYSAITATTTAQAWYHYSVDTSGGAVTLNLPALASVTDGDEIRVKLRVAGNALTIDANSTETIDGSRTYTLDVAYQAITLIAGSTEWEII